MTSRPASLLANAVLVFSLALLIAVGAWYVEADHVQSGRSSATGMHLTQADWQVQDVPDLPDFSTPPPSVESQTLPDSWQPVRLPGALPMAGPQENQAAGQHPIAANSSANTTINAGIRTTWIKLSTEGRQLPTGQLALYGVRIKTEGTVAIYADGRLVKRAQQQGPRWNSLFTPLWIVLDRHPGDGPLREILIRVQHPSNTRVALSSLWLGPPKALRGRYYLRQWLQRELPMWTVGRDQITQVSARQQKHVVVFGAGAIGSPVVEQLAKAGIGKITLVDSDIIETANVGRHLLGAQHVNYGKAEAVANDVTQSYPSCVITPYDGTAEEWLWSNTLEGVDTALDLTGEPEVRWHLNEARRQHPCKLIIGWMEPFVAAAHVCMLTPEKLWFALKASTQDKLNMLEAVDWPAEVIRQVPGCSSRFQAYTSANAAYAVALVSENALRLVDDEVESSAVLSWVRGRQFLDRQWPNLTYRDWAAEAAQHVGFMKERPFV
jgi:molybdopterin/thiamine biosynthesis adenylyltransferase